MNRVFSSLISNRFPNRTDNHSSANHSSDNRSASGEPTGRNLQPFDAWQRSCSGAVRFLLGGLAELCYPPTCVLCHGPLGLEDRPPQAIATQESAAEKKPAEDFTAEDFTAEAVPAQGPRSLCGGCRATLRATAAEWACDRCSRPQPPVSVPLCSGEQEDALSILGGGTARHRLCPWCRKRSGEIQRSVALGMYRDVMREAVVAAKRLSFQPLTLALGEMLGHRVRQAWGAVPIGAVTFIPSHWTRRWGRGGCPAQLLANQVGRVIEAPVMPILRSCRKTAKQGTLGDGERRTNVCGAFSAKKGYALLAPRVLVVDDVWTTGATLEEAARVIRQGYDAEVFAAVIARAIGTHDG